MVHEVWIWTMSCKTVMGAFAWRSSIVCKWWHLMKGWLGSFVDEWFKCTLCLGLLYEAYSPYPFYIFTLSCMERHICPASVEMEVFSSVECSNFPSERLFCRFAKNQAPKVAFSHKKLPATDNKKTKSTENWNTFRGKCIPQTYSPRSVVSNRQMG